jgi:hypothetical protein
LALFVVLLYVAWSCQQDNVLQDKGTEIISRINYGIYFRKIATLDINTQYWDHVFKIQIPQFDYEVPTTPACDAAQYSQDFCIGYSAAKNLISR